MVSGCVPLLSAGTVHTAVKSRAGDLSGCIICWLTPPSALYILQSLDCLPRSVAALMGRADWCRLRCSAYALAVVGWWSVHRLLWALALTRPFRCTDSYGPSHWMSGCRGGCLSGCPLLVFYCIVASIFVRWRQRQSLATTASTFKLDKTIRGPRVECSGVSVDTSGKR